MFWSILVSGGLGTESKGMAEQAANIQEVREYLASVLCADEHKPDPRLGRLIARRYKVQRVLGRGAGGTVFLCHDITKGHREIAVKLLTSNDNDIATYERFHRESKVAREVRSPFLVRSFDTFFDDGLFGFTMEYIPGVDLGALLTAIPRLPIDVVINVALQTAFGLEALHLAGLIHRDLKPANVMVTSELGAKLTDFGIARSVQSSASPASTTTKLRFLDLTNPTKSKTFNAKLTQNEDLLGTADYFSPEYILHGKIDCRSDLYSFGVVVYEMLTGEVPYPVGGGLKGIWERVRRSAPDLEIIFPHYHPAFLKLIMQCLERDPTKRPQSIGDVVEILQALQLENYPPR